jgi:hypothetical protein
MLQGCKSQHEDVPLQTQQDIGNNLLETETRLTKIELQIEVESLPNQLEVSDIMISKEHFN